MKLSVLKPSIQNPSAPEPAGESAASGQAPERRTAQRLDSPLGGNCSASFLLSGSYVELQLHDISLGGVALRCAPREAARLYVGRRLRKVRFDLGPDGSFVCDLEVRLLRRFRSYLAGEQVQVGCRFSALTPQMEQVLRRALARVKGMPGAAAG